MRLTILLICLLCIITGNSNITSTSTSSKGNNISYYSNTMNKLSLSCAKLRYLMLCPAWYYLVLGRQCWSCDGVGNTCSSATDMGRMVKCPQEVTSCFKSHQVICHILSQMENDIPPSTCRFFLTHTVRRCGGTTTGTKCLESSIHILVDNQFVAAWVSLIL